MQAGLKKELRDEEILECASKVSRLTTAQFSEHKAQLVVEAASDCEVTDEVLLRLCGIRLVFSHRLHADAYPDQFYLAPF